MGRGAGVVRSGAAQALGLKPCQGVFLRSKTWLAMTRLRRLTGEQLMDRADHFGAPFTFFHHFEAGDVP